MGIIGKFFTQWAASGLLYLHRKMEMLAEAQLPEFANSPRNVRIERLWRIFHPHRIHIGDDVSIGPGSLIVPQTRYPSSVMRHPEMQIARQTFDPRIVIGNRVTSTGMLTIAAMQEITIEDDVMFASNVMVSDGMHGFETANVPYKYQKMWKIAPIVIKRGCWLGQNVVVMPGVTIGELSIVGANSVVTKSIPRRSMAVGAPARLIKRWDETAGKWIPVGDA